MRRLGRRQEREPPSPVLAGHGTKAARRPHDRATENRRSRHRRRDARDRAPRAQDCARTCAFADGAEGQGTGGYCREPSAGARPTSSPPMPRIWRRPNAAAPTAAFLDRLALDDKRVAAMASGVEVIRDLADPVGEVTERWTRPNGMTIERVRVPLGVVGIVYESRPNVTADAAALCLKAGNAAILRGGSESQRSNRAIHDAIVDGLAGGGPAGGRDPTGANARPRRSRHDARRPRRRDRRDRAARRQEPGRARAGGSARAGVRASRRHLPRLRGQGRLARHGETDRAQRKDAAHRRLRRGRDAAGRSRGRANAS